jgi:SAM-dependent methyltransferase
MTEATAAPTTGRATERTACGACGGDRLHRFLDLGMSPVAGDFPTTAERERMAPRFPLRLATCQGQDCTLVQLVDIIPGDVLYGRDYPYYSGASKPVVTHMSDYAAWVMARYPRLLREHGVLEIAANDGTLLQWFARAGIRTLGVEPAAGPAAYAAGEHGLTMVVEPFGATLAHALAGGKFGVIIANNVLAHVEDLGDFLTGVRTALHPDGVAIFEVQYLPDLLLGNAFDLVYHEHRSFFSLTSLRALLAAHGLAVTDVVQHEMQGGSIRVVARHAGPLAWPEHTVGHLLRAETWLGTSGTADPFSGVQGRVNRVRDRLRELLAREGSRTVVGYAASAKATTLLSFVGLDVDRIAYMVDTTPVKWGRYMPGTSIPIIDSREIDARVRAGYLASRPDTYLLTVGNYLPAVLRREAAFLAGGGRIITPLPVPTII